MQKRTIEIAVGIFFLMGIASFIMLAIKVSGLGDVYVSNEGYTITADFENIGGLKPRAKVTIAGVSIGRVTAIDFDPKEYLARVTIFIDSKANNIPDDTKASILTAGLLGDNYIGLTPGFSEHYFKEGSHISQENTNKAVVLEELVSKFVSGQASGYKE
jgi:phospholipid/cholesterol/gamma-HCH transport system substrate-binding protein